MMPAADTTHLTELASSVSAAVAAGQWELAANLAAAVQKLLAPDSTVPPRDPMGDFYRGKGTSQRADVREAFNLWRRAASQPKARLHHHSDMRAEAIAAALDAGHDLAWVAGVLEAARFDEMVNGKADKTGQAHWSPTYIFRPDVADRLYALYETRKQAEARRARLLSESAPDGQPGASTPGVGSDDIERLLKEMR